MSNIKEKILYTVELMDDDDAMMLLNWLTNNYVAVYKNKDWDDIEEVEPDEIDLEMMADIETNPDCKEFTSKEELMARRIARKSTQ